MRQQQDPGRFASFDLDVALALVGRFVSDFGATVIDVDYDTRGVVFVMDVPEWGRLLDTRNRVVAGNHIEAN